MPDRFLDELQRTIDREIPICLAMGIRVHALDASGLTLSLPLEVNRNHKQTAFGGSLNALCTLSGWGHVYCLLRQTNHVGAIVIRRSSIRYLRPVTAPLILATCLPESGEDRAYFLEMLQEKGLAKLDLEARIFDEGGPAVFFSGSYVADLTR